MDQNWNPGEPLPMAQSAEVDIRRFIEYSMNPDNPANQGKWLAFAVLGYEVQNVENRTSAAQDIMNQLRQELTKAQATLGKTSIYGLRFQVRIRIQGLNTRQGTLVTNWQIDIGKNVPRLITNWLEVDQ